MASDNEASCESDPNFAVICAFMEKFGTTCGLQSIDFLELQEMLENTQEVPQELIDLHIKLLRKSRKTVSNERWEKAIIKFCHTFCVQDAWEIERFGYKKARLSSKLRVLKELLEMQFDFNARFKAEINKMSAEELRSQPLGKDKQGHAYWFQNDNNCQIRVYKEDPDEETWTLVAKDRDGLASLISELSDGDSKISSESAINEDDSNSLAEKPIIDTGQVDSSSSDSNKKLSGESDNSNESESLKKEQHISQEDEESSKRDRESDDDSSRDVKKPKNEDVGDAIEEPLMLVKGEGEGEENQCVNPIVGEEIEEDLMFFYGNGNGVDCQTGNEEKASDSQSKSSQGESGESARDASLVSISDSKNCVNDEVPTSPVKSPYKLGTIIDTKTDNKFFSAVKSPTKKSRWDVETIIAKDAPETGRVKELVSKWEEQIPEEPPKKAMFFFGPGCLQFTPATMAFGQKVPPEKKESLEVLPDKTKGDVGYRIAEESRGETSECVQSEKGPLVNEVDHQTPIETRIDKLEIEEIGDNVGNLEQTKVDDKVRAALEEQVVTETDETGPIPEVTAALVEYKQPEEKETVKIIVPESTVPVVEEVCVKKHAYLLGGEEKVVENHEEKGEVANAEIKDQKDENENRQVDAIKEDETESPEEDQPPERVTESPIEKPDQSSESVTQSPVEKADQPTESVPEQKAESPIESMDQSSESAMNQKPESPVENTDQPLESVPEQKAESPLESMDQSSESATDQKPESPVEKTDQPLESVPEQKAESPLESMDQSSESAMDQKSESPVEKTDQPLESVPEQKTESPVESMDQTSESATDQKPERPVEKADQPLEKVPEQKAESPLESMDQSSESATDQKPESPVETTDQPVESVPEQKAESPLESMDQSSESATDQKPESPVEKDGSGSAQKIDGPIEKNEQPLENITDQELESPVEKKEQPLESVEQNSESSSWCRDQESGKDETASLEVESHGLSETKEETKDHSIAQRVEEPSERVDQKSEIANDEIVDHKVEDLDQQSESVDPEPEKDESKSETTICEQPKFDQKEDNRDLESPRHDNRDDDQQPESVNASFDQKLDNGPEKNSEVAVDECQKVENDKKPECIDRKDESETTPDKKVEIEAGQKPESPKIVENDQQTVEKKDETLCEDVDQKSDSSFEDATETQLDDFSDNDEPVNEDCDDQDESGTLENDQKPVSPVEERQDPPKPQPNEEITETPEVPVETIEPEPVKENATEKTKSDEKTGVEESEVEEKKEPKPVKKLVEIEAELPQEDKKTRDKRDLPTKEAVVYLKLEDKLKADDKTSKAEEKEPQSVPAKRGRKNNSSDQSADDEKKPRISTRRTRQSKNDEDVEEKVIEVPPPTRRGRPRLNQKAAKEDTSEGDSKKMKLSEESSRTLRSKPKDEPEEKPEPVGPKTKQTVAISRTSRSKSKDELEEKAEDTKSESTKKKVVEESSRTLRSKPKDEPEEKVETVEGDSGKKTKQVESSSRTLRSKSKDESEETAGEVEGDSSKKIKLTEETPRTRRSKSKDETEEDVNPKPEKDVVPSTAAETVVVESSSSSNDILEITDKDPLAAASEEEVKEKKEKPMSLATFSLDFNESPTPTPPVTRSGLRKRGRESPVNSEETEETVGKRPKMKAKRSVDVKLRKSIEEQKKKELVSSDEDSKTEQAEEKKKKHGKSEEAIVVSSDAEKDSERVKKQKSPKNKNKRLLSNLGIDPEQALSIGLAQTGVRQSRRIAQQKIKEEAERRKLEEELAIDTHKKKKSKKNEDKDYKVEKKKKNEEDEEDVDDDSGDSKKRKKKKKKKKHRKFDELNPWRSSSDSSSSNEEDEMGEEEEEEDEVLQYVSDHEFSPESDMEGDGEALPLKRARTAKKESDVEEEVDDCPCQKCGKSDHPEWILLCDSCDNGWHCSCLRPPLLVIPEGDWFCPPCQHASLLGKLQEKLNEYDKKLSKKEIENRRKQRLAYVGISLNSVLPTKETENIKKRRISMKDDDDDEDDLEGEDASSEDSDSGSASASETGSDSDEPIYQLRQRRQAHSYRFNDYDDLINSAIQDEMEAVKGAGNQGRGKDIATIVNAEKEEERKKEEATQAEGETVEYEPLPPVIPQNEKDKEPRPIFGDDEVIHVKKKIIGRKKHRRLNALDISSADEDEDSDEDFKGTSSESDDDFDEDLGSDDSDDLGGRNRRKGNDPVRRSTRARTSRYDADFIDDGDSDSEDAAPRRKKKRSIWDESESEESDRSWGRRKRKPASRSKKTTPSNSAKKKKSKKKKKQQDSDEEVYKKKKPKIKFGLDGDDDGPVRRTRGKKINYVDALGSDSDDDRVKRPPPRIDSDEEYVANEDEKNSEEEVDSGDENLKAQKVQIQSYTDARFVQVLPEPKNHDDADSELNPIDQINRNVEMMDENEMEKMMEEEEYANKQLQMVALQLEKEKRRKEREAKKLEGILQQPMIPDAKKRMRKKDPFQFSQEPLVGNVDSLIVNSENNDELSEPPGVSLPLFAELGPGEGLEDPARKRRGKSKKSLEEAVANLGSGRQLEPPPFLTMGNKLHPTDLSVAPETNIEIAAPPQPFSQSQPTPSVITRMLQSKPGQPGYPVGTIRPKQFAAMPDREDDVHHAMAASPGLPGQYIQGAGGLRPQLGSPYRPMAPALNHYPRAVPPPPIRNPVPHIFHTHRPMDPSPSGGGTISISEHSSPSRVVSPASSSPGSNKNETPPPPYARPSGVPPTGRFPMGGAGARHLQMVPPPHLQPPRPNLSPYHPGMPPQYHYGQFGQEDALPPTMYQNSPYSEPFEGQVNPSENSNSKSFEEESGGEFGGLVSYFSSQREDDLES